MELKRYLQIVFKWWWLIVLCTLLAAVVSYVVSSVVPPVYRASTSMLVSAGGVTGNDYSTLLANQQLAATYTELLVKRPIIEAVAAELGLDPRQVQRKVKVRLIPNTTLIELTAEYDDPRLAMEIANGVVAAFRQTLRESGGVRSRDVVVVEPAIQPLEPAAPRKLLNTAVAAIVGLGMAAGAAFLVEYLNDTLETVEHVQQALSLPALTAIPCLDGRRKSGQELAPFSDPGSPRIEAYRTLRTKIQLAGENDKLRTVLITSPSSRDETASIVANLGVVMAQSGFKVLLVDADLRQPQLHRVWQLEKEAGLSTLLSGEGNYRDCIAETGIPNLRLLPGGAPPPDPLDLLNSQRMAQLMDGLATQADLVLFSAPPVLAVADTALLAARMDGTILAVESRSTPRPAATLAVKTLQDAGARVIGVILNRVRQ